MTLTNAEPTPIQGTQWPDKRFNGVGEERVLSQRS
jgi:hypothetical protein